MFSNLLNNALKYLDPSRPGKIHITGRQEGDRVIYCVADNGIGIPLKHQKKIFEIFHRLNPEDTIGEGLGLTIVNKIISLHGGDIWIESRPGKGSRFFISLSAAISVKKQPNSPPGQ
jgi:signal transduction histidine kinase